MRIYENAPVLGLTRHMGTVHQVKTPRGEVRAQQVMLATGTSAVGPLAWFRRRIVPVGAFIIVTEPLFVEVLSRLMPRRRMITDTKTLLITFGSHPTIVCCSVVARDSRRQIPLQT